MSDIKLSVTIVLPGRTMMTSQECDKNPRANYKKVSLPVSVKSFDKKTKKTFFKTESLEFYTRKCKTAQQVIKMCDEAYEYMTSQMCPEWFHSLGGPSQWKIISKKQRLEHHLDRICTSLGGLSYTYDIYKD